MKASLSSLTDQQLKHRMMIWYRKAHSGINGDERSLKVYNTIVQEISKRKNQND